MKNKSLGWYLGATVASVLAFALTTCIVSVILKFTLTFVTWVF